MPWLTLNGYTIPLANASPVVDVTEVGERGRVSDGTPRSGVRARKNVWRCTTGLIGLYEGAVVQNVLTMLGQPLAANGDLVSNVATDTVATNVGRATTRKVKGGTRTVITFELWEV